MPLCIMQEAAVIFPGGRLLADVGYGTLLENLSNMKRVLIVDDEKDLCMMVKIYLTKKNYEVYTANSLGEGLEKMHTIKLDSLLLDNNLPDGMGWKMALNIKEQFPEMHITLVSAHHDSRAFKNQLSESFTILEKPISLKSIEQYL